MHLVLMILLLNYDWVKNQNIRMSKPISEKKPHEKVRASAGSIPAGQYNPRVI